MTEYVFTLSDSTPRVEITVEPVAAAVADDLYQRARREGFDGTFDEFLTKFKGEKGDDGLPGQPGNDGQPGLEGTATTVEIGTVTTGETASVTNSGTANAAVLDFVLPKAIEYAEFEFSPVNGGLGTVKFKKPFSKMPDVFLLTLNFIDNVGRLPYVSNCNAEGFDIGTNYAPSLQGVWYRAAVKK